MAGNRLPLPSAWSGQPTWNVLVNWLRRNVLRTSLSGVENVMISGIIAAAGGIVSGSGFTVTHPEAGVYKIHLEKTLTGVTGVSATDAQGTRRTGSVTLNSFNEITVSMSQPSLALENIQFSFVIIGWY